MMKRGIGKAILCAHVRCRKRFRGRGGITVQGGGGQLPHASPTSIYVGSKSWKLFSSRPHTRKVIKFRLSLIRIFCYIQYIFVEFHDWLWHLSTSDDFNVWILLSWQSEEKQIHFLEWRFQETFPFDLLTSFWWLHSGLPVLTKC